jgi:hypothetical protein
MKRREFIMLIGGAAAAWPRAARAQQPERMRRIGVLTGLVEDDPEAKARLAGFQHGLEKRGWSKGHNVSIDTRFAPDSSADQAQVLAKELIALQPDVILAQTTPVVAALQREEPDDSNRVRGRRRPDRVRICREPAAARRQYHRCDAVRGERHRQVVDDAQGDRAAS